MQIWIFWCWKSFLVTGSLDSEAGIYALSYDVTGTRLITCEADKTIKMWKEDEHATSETHPLNFRPPKEIRRFWSQITPMFSGRAWTHFPEKGGWVAHLSSCISWEHWKNRALLYYFIMSWTVLQMLVSWAQFMGEAAMLMKRMCLVSENQDACPEAMTLIFYRQWCLFMSDVRLGLAHLYVCKMCFTRSLHLKSPSLIGPCDSGSSSSSAHAKYSIFFPADKTVFHPNVPFQLASPPGIVVGYKQNSFAWNEKCLGQCAKAERKIGCARVAGPRSSRWSGTEFSCWAPRGPNPLEPNCVGRPKGTPTNGLTH